MLLLHRLVETIASSAQLLTWRLDPRLARLESSGLQTKAGARTFVRAEEVEVLVKAADPAVRVEASDVGVGAAQNGAGRPDCGSLAGNPEHVHCDNDGGKGRAAVGTEHQRQEGQFRRAATGRRTRLVAHVSVSATLALLVLPYANHLLWSGRYPASYWHQAAGRMLRPPVYDSTGMLAGFVVGEAGQYAGEVYAIQPDAVPDACVDLVLLREDRHFDAGLRHALGVDWLRLASAVVTRRGGASTLPMQLARQLAGWQTTMAPLSRKWREFGVAQAVLDAHRGDYRALARTYMATAPFAQFQGDVRGVAAAAEVMWGQRASQLSPAQCALLVTMLPVRMDLKDESARSTLQWAARKGQAEILLREAYGAEAEPMLAEVRAGGAQAPRRSLIEPLGPTATYNLDARTRRLVTPHLERIAADGRSSDAEPTPIASTEPTP